MSSGPQDPVSLDTNAVTWDTYYFVLGQSMVFFRLFVVVFFYDDILVVSSILIFLTDMVLNCVFTLLTLRVFNDHTHI